MDQEHATETEATPALVLQRWNSWVQVFLPATGETRWVDLSSVPHEPLAAARA